MTTSSEDQRTVGQMLSEMKEICNRLEQDDITLEEKIVLYEKGVAIGRSIESVLKSAQHTVELIRPDGTIVPFVSEPLDMNRKNR
jgi:exodeoxyribonuclease VII small subunit